MPRSREFDPTEALGKAMQLFWQRGYADTSLDDLVRHTGVSRYGLYSAFGGKRELFLAALDHYRDTVITGRLRALESPDASWAEVKRYFGELVHVINNSGARVGCLMCNTATEVAPHDEAVADRVGAHFGRLSAAFHNALRNAVTRGELPAYTDVDAKADFLAGVAQGLFVLSRSPNQGQAIERLVRTALNAISA